MKVSPPRFGFCGIVTQGLQSWKDATNIGWFTAMTMIRNILIMTVIPALVPTAMSNVSASSDSEIALFSGVSDSNGLTITGNGDSVKMELKATNDNGKSNKVSDFQLTADNVLSTEVGDKVTVIDNVDFTKAITTDARNNQKAVGITSNGVIDFTGYNQGVYTLDVVVDDDRAYEAIIAIGYQTNQIVDKEITRVNSEYRIEFVFPPIKDPECKEGEELIDGKCEPIRCPEGEELIDGKCVPYSCPAHAGGCEPCDEGFVLEGEECVPEPEPVACKLIESYNEDTAKCEFIGPIDEPEPIECSEDEELVDGQCQPITTNPVEPIDPLLIDENSDDQSIIGDDDSDESEDDGQGEESGGDDSEGSEESGGSEGETSE
jgi:hypothetical protein